MVSLKVIAFFVIFICGHFTDSMLFFGKKYITRKPGYDASYVVLLKTSKGFPVTFGVVIGKKWILTNGLPVIFSESLATSIIAYDSKGKSYTSKAIHIHRSKTFLYDFGLIEVNEDFEMAPVNLPDAHDRLLRGTIGEVIGEYNIVRMNLNFDVKRTMMVLDRNQCNLMRPQQGLDFLAMVRQDAAFCARSVRSDRCEFKKFVGPFVTNKKVYSVYGACFLTNGNYLFESYVPLARDWIKEVSHI